MLQTPTPHCSLISFLQHLQPFRPANPFLLVIRFNTRPAIAFFVTIHSPFTRLSAKCHRQEADSGSLPVLLPNPHQTFSKADRFEAAAVAVEEDGAEVAGEEVATAVAHTSLQLPVSGIRSTPPGSESLTEL